MAQPETIETKIEFLLPGAAKRNKVPSWPPDVFCLCAAILQNSGAYSRVVNDSDAENHTGESKKRAQNLSRIGTAWAKAVSANRQPPRQISNWWSEVFNARKMELHALGDDNVSACRRALMDLLGAADEASVCTNAISQTPRQLLPMTDEAAGPKGFASPSNNTDNQSARWV